MSKIMMVDDSPTVVDDSNLLSASRAYTRMTGENPRELLDLEEAERDLLLLAELRLLARRALDSGTVRGTRETRRECPAKSSRAGTPASLSSARDSGSNRSVKAQTPRAGT